MADLCRECGIRLDMDGLCQCPEVLLAEIERLRAENAQCALEITRQNNAISLLDHIDPGHLDKVTVAYAKQSIDEQAATVRSLRAKLMRERASGLEALAMALPDNCHREGNVLHARARRLRAEAERVEGGGR